tara:strand:+ start:682 stop:1239 length:558 start_codon:yes stop_codon:yes gene_type:complete
MNFFKDHLNLSNNIYDNAKILKANEIYKNKLLSEDNLGRIITGASQLERIAAKEGETAAETLARLNAARFESDMAHFNHQISQEALERARQALIAAEKEAARQAAAAASARDIEHGLHHQYVLSNSTLDDIQMSRPQIPTTPWVPPLLKKPVSIAPGTLASESMVSRPPISATPVRGQSIAMPGT